MDPTFERTTSQAFLPAFAWIFDLAAAAYRPLNRQLAQDLDLLTRPRPPLPSGRNRQTEQILHELEEVADLMQVFEAAVARVLTTLEVDDDSFALTGCWGNWNPSGARHPPHTRPNNALSDLYDVRTPEGRDRLSFHDPGPQVDLIARPVRKANVFNSTVHNIPVAAGRLIIFPAWFVHSVLANQSQKERLSISFNVTLPDPQHRISRPKWRGIPVRGTRKVW